MIKIAEASDVRQALINAINRQSGDRPKWLTRADIAQGLGKKELNPSDILMLNLMAESGEIERQLVDASHAGIRRFQYRLAQQ